MTSPVPALTHESETTLAATPERVFRALTEEAELGRWFAEHVEVDLRPGGPFRFWGRHTYGAPSRAHATQVVTRVERPSLIAFSWPLEGCESEVTLRIEAASDDAHSVLKVTHHFPVAPPVDRPLDLIEDLWRAAVSNLSAYLSGSDVLWLPDFSDPVPRIRQTVLIEASRDQVFRALLEPAMLNRWIAVNAVVEPHVGGCCSYGWNYEVRGRSVAGGPTKILELVEDTKLVTDWPDWRGDPSRPVQRVSWLLEYVGDFTRVTVIHEPFERVADLSDYPQGWTGFLAELKRSVEGASRS